MNQSTVIRLIEIYRGEKKIKLLSMDNAKHRKTNREMYRHQ